MIVGGGDDPVEGGGALAIAVRLQHGGEIGGIDGIVGRIFGDVFQGSISQNGRHEAYRTIA